MTEKPNQPIGRILSSAALDARQKQCVAELNAAADLGLCVVGISRLLALRTEHVDAIRTQWEREGHITLEQGRTAQAAWRDRL